MREPKRHWPRHEKWVRGHFCSVPGCQMTDIEFAHVRDAENAGTGLKPASWHGVSLCSMHHREQHDCGVETFMKNHGIDLWRIAYEFAAKSPDTAMKAEMPLDRRMSA